MWSRKSVASSVTVETYLTGILEGSFNLRASTLYHFKLLAKNHVYPAVGHVKVRDLTSSDVRQLLVDVMADAGASPAANVRILLNKVYKQAMAEGLVERNPVASVPVPKRKPREVVPLTPEQVQRLAGCIHPRYRVAVLLSAYTGLRVSEVGGLRVADLDLDNARLHVKKAATKRGVGEPKTAAARRSVSLPGFLVEELRAHLVAFPPTADGRVFSTGRGGLVTAESLHKVFKGAVERAGLPDNTRFHDLRHTAASLAIAVGAHPKVIQARLGHADIQTTLNVYGHLFEGMDADLAEALDRRHA
jgi:integrase